MLLLDFTELLLDFALELDFAELLEATLDDERTELLLDRSSTGAEDDERTLLLDFALELDFAELLEATLDDERTLLLDRSSTGAEDDERTELLLASSQSSQTLDEESSPGRTKLLSSSSQAASASVNARANTRRTDPRLREDDSRNVVTT